MYFVLIKRHTRWGRLVRLGASWGCVERERHPQAAGTGPSPGETDGRIKT